MEIEIQEDEMWTSEDNDVDGIIHSAVVYLNLSMGTWLYPILAVY